MTKRRLYSLIFVIFGLILFFICYLDLSEPVSYELYEYYIENFYNDTYSENAVTAIYLNYRVFDTLFETLTLLVSVVGVMYFSRHSLVKMDKGGDDEE